MNNQGEEGPDGLAQIRAMIASKRRDPIGNTLNYQLVEAEHGYAVFEGNPDQSVYNPLGAVHGGYFATLLDSACAIATHSTLGPGRGQTTLELKVSYLHRLGVDSGTVRATGRVVSSGRRVAFAQAELHDGKGRLCATASSTLLVFDVEAGDRGSLRETPPEPDTSSEL